MSETKVYTVAEIREKVSSDAAWAEKAIVRLFEQQTPDEQSKEMTEYHNCKGFNAVDAAFLTSLAKQIIRRQEWCQKKNLRFFYGGSLSDKQLPYAFKKLGKYAVQLYILAYGKEPKAERKPKAQKFTVEASELGETNEVVEYSGITFFFVDAEQDNEGEMVSYRYVSKNRDILTVLND